VEPRALVSGYRRFAVVVTVAYQVRLRRLKPYGLSLPLWVSAADSYSPAGEAAREDTSISAVGYGLT